MTTKKIETISVNAVRNSIVSSEYLDENITDNDKGPFWDGNVFLYKGKKTQPKSDFLGRVPVQVKGIEKNDFSKKEIRYPVSVTDLDGYFKDGGVVFFVVYIQSESLATKIYFSEFLPLTLRFLLSEVTDKKSKTITFREFPTDHNEMATIFKNFYNHCQNQRSYINSIDIKLPTIEELLEMGVLESVTTSIYGYNLSAGDPVSELLKYPAPFYAKIRGNPVPQPLDIMPQELHISEDRPCTVSVNGVEFYSHVTAIRSKDTYTVKIGASLRLITSAGKNSTRVKLDFKGSEMLRMFALDLKFILSAINAGCFEVNGSYIPFVLEEIDQATFSIEREEKRVEFLAKAVQVLDMCEIKGDVNITQLTKEEWLNLERLAKALINKEPVSGLRDDLPPVSPLKIGNYLILVSVRKVADQPGTYVINDLFQGEVLFGKDNNDDMHPIPTCAILRADHYLCISNVPYRKLVSSFQEICTPYAIDRANWTLLELLHACDMSDRARPELLETAHQLASWLYDAGAEILPIEVRKLNLLQSIKRIRRFSENEEKELYEMIDAYSHREDIIVGAYLLLGQQIPARLHFERLDTELQELFITYPIYHFWQDNIG